MKSKAEAAEKSQVKLTIEVDPAEFEKGVQAAYKRTVKRYNIPGFRRGKAPRMMIENYYGEAIFYEDAFNEIFPDAYEKAVKEQELEPVAQPVVDVEAIGKKEGMTITCMVTIKPEVELGEYKGLEVERKLQKVSDDDVEHELYHARERVASFEEVEDRPAKEGDTVTLAYEGFLDGEPFEGGKDENGQLVLGEGRFIPGFEEQVVGMNKGDKKDINVTFPEQYHAEHLAGKPVVFKVELKNITERILPELDDEFAKDVSEYDTLDEYKESVRKDLEERKANMADSQVENDLVTKASENAKIDIPDAMVEQQIDYMLRDMEYRMMYQGMRMEDYLKFTGQTIEQMRDQQRQFAEERVRMQLTMEAIAQKENVEVTDEDWEKELTPQAESQKKTWQEIKDAQSEDEAAYIRERIVAGKTVDILKSNAKITDVEVEAEAHDHDHGHDHDAEADTEEE